MQEETVTQDNAEITNVKTVKTTVGFPADLWKAVRKIAIDRGVPAPQVVIEVMEQWLKDQR